MVEQRPPRARRKRERVLVVEDDPDVASLVVLNLELAGFEVEVAYDGAAALAAARARKAPDLILLDVMLQVLDGWSVLRELKDQPETRGIPVVMLTALTDEKDVIKGHLEGAVRYVTKPFSVTDLVAEVETALAPSDEDTARRRATVRTLVRRLAELDAGRSGSPSVRLSRLEATRSARRRSRGPEKALDMLSDRQRVVATAIARGATASQIAVALDVSRSNVYALRKRSARKLGVEPSEVESELRRLGL